MPIRLAISVEGETEESFVNDVLSPWLMQHNANLTAVTPINMRGEISITKTTKELKKLSPCFDFVTTLYDFYGFRRKQSKTKEQLEKEINNDTPDNVLPYIQMHEFEGLLFSNPTAISNHFTNPQLEQWGNDVLRRANNNPEQINDSPETAPKKRLKGEIVEYKEITDGIPIAKSIGIQNIKDNCPNFRAWVDQLESLT